MIGSSQQGMFIPLVRLRLESEDGRHSAALPRIFAVGLPGASADAPLGPIRLDIGPRAIREPGTREIEVEKWLPDEGLRQAV